MAKEVFISYCSPDKEIAHEIYKAIEDCGITVWIAPDCIPIGANYGGAIDLAIEECSIMVVVYSNACNTSEHVANEIDTAFNEGKFIIPFCIDDSPMSRNLRYYLRRKQHLNAFPNYKVHIQKLLDTLCSALGRSNMDTANNQVPSQVSSLSPSAPESSVSTTEVGYNENKRQAKKRSTSFMNKLMTIIDVYADSENEEDCHVYAVDKETSKNNDIPKSLLFEVEGKKFYMILSDDEKFYIGNVHTTGPDLNWLNNKWVNNLGNVALCAGAKKAPFSTLFSASFDAFKSLSFGKKSYFYEMAFDVASKMEVNKEFCDNLSERTGYLFRLPHKEEFKGVKDYAIPYCIVLHLKENTALLAKIKNKKLSK